MIYTSIKNRFGEHFIAATDKGVCTVALNSSEKKFRLQLKEQYEVDAVREDRFLSIHRRQLEDYFGGRLTVLAMPLDLKGTEFQTAVWNELRKVPHGKTVTYGELADKIGHKGASRAVGNACGRNPVPIVVPCHRVLANGGKIGGFTGGIPLKRFLLKLEGVNIGKD
jgi:methylated-DNA-[protein]-cysteine S-methyltransferase